MSAAGLRSVPARPRPALALILSIAAHGVVLYAVSRLPWSSHELETREVLQVVWLNDLTLTATREPTAASEPEAQPAEPAPPPDEAPDDEPPNETAPRPPAREDTPPAQQSNDTAPAPTPGDTERKPRYLRPRIDFEEERKRAVAKVLEQRDGANDYVTFSLDDLAEDAPPKLEPIVPAMDAPRDNCVIVKGKIQRMLMLLMNRCVRGPRDDMFAGLKPAYLEKRPLCEEVRVTPPPLVPGKPENEVVAIKCRLVDEAELVAARENDLNR